jgi:Ca2+-binding EF-hand superfamily protein
LISKKFSSVRDCFEEISERMSKISIAQFRKFLDDTRALSGFNLSKQLVNELFSEIDPHKKGYLVENDWVNAFGSYDWKSQLINEFKNAISCHFQSAESAFEYLASQTTKNGTTLGSFKNLTADARIGPEDFEKAVKTVLHKRFSPSDMKIIWTQLSKNGNIIDNSSFLKNFSSIAFKGTGTLKTFKTSFVSTQGMGRSSSAAPVTNMTSTLPSNNTGTLFSNSAFGVN